MRKYSKYTPVDTRYLLLAASSLLFAGNAAASTPSLSFSSYASVSGYLRTDYESALLGNVSFQLSGQSDYQSYQPFYQYGSPNPHASASYNVPAGANSGITDPIYDVVTNSGQYGYSYTGEAQALGTNLKTKMSASVVDVDNNLVDPWNDNLTTSLDTHSNASWSQQFYIAPTATKAQGSYGAILVGITLEGNFPALSDTGFYNDASAYLEASSSFQDTAGVSYSSDFEISTWSNDETWTGSKTVYKKLLFQYGTAFDIDLYQAAHVYGNGSADFFNTGYISAIEIPFGSTLESGAEQAGLGDASQLYGRVYNSASDDAENTNWDFGNNGGGFTPPPANVPLPAAAWSFIAGLMGMLSIQRRRNRDL